MKRVLLVDDDPLVLRVYRDGLRRRGFDVESAQDGLAAAKALQTGKPDVMVLDLMMPKLSGVDVLKYVRAQPNLADLPVVVLSNAYMTDLAREAATAGADKALLKAGCTPAILAEIIHGLLQGKESIKGETQLLGVPEAEPKEEGNPKNPAPLPAGATRVSAISSLARRSIRPLLPSGGQTEAQFMTKARVEFLESGSATCLALQSLFQAFHKARNDAERGVRLESLYRKVHFLTVSARVAECPCLTQMASVLEALLFELIANPTRMCPSIFRTIALAVDFLGVLFERDQQAPSGPPPQARILVLDDDQFSNRSIISALRNANFEAESAEDPIATLAWLDKKHFDLILVDLEMPGIDGFEFCRRARQLPGCQHTPIIYITVHSAFENRVKGALSGGQDLIAKPIFPMELAVKVVTQIMKSQVMPPPGRNKAAGTGAGG